MTEIKSWIYKFLIYHNVNIFIYRLILILELYFDKNVKNNLEYKKINLANTLHMCTTTKSYIVNSFLWLVSRQICVLTYFMWSKTRAWIMKSNKTFNLFLLWITMKVFLPNMLFMFVFSLVVFSWSIKVKKC